MSPQARQTLYLSCIIGALIGLLSVVVMMTLDRHGAGHQQTGECQDVAPARVGGPFALTDHDGRPVTDASYLGKPKIVFFGFTSCPDICPTTLGALATLMADLGPDSARLHALFITVDPERDTPEKLQDYIALFDRRIIALTGAPHQIEATARAFAVHYEKVPQGDTYAVSHTVAALLFDDNWKFIRTLDLQRDYSEALAAVKSALRQDKAEKPR